MGRPGARRECRRAAAAAVRDVDDFEPVREARQRRQVQGRHSRSRSDDADAAAHPISLDPKCCPAIPARLRHLRIKRT
ncbi:hypothetical protein GCM10025760_06450 [Microbacterium yannicii]|uniref:Uncharacterized protein n=1 Tax=Microbacterium yannicii TaxID=671622 RepID=A0ABP9LVP4_9MICO